MKSIKCMLGMHSYSQASAEVKAVDERYGYLICRVRNCCVNCGKAFEDIIPIPIPEWLSKKDEVESDIDENWYSDEYRRIGEDEVERKSK